jgi:hypothetical protein
MAARLWILWGGALAALALVGGSIYLSRSYRNMIDRHEAPVQSLFQPIDLLVKDRIVWILVDGLGYRDFPKDLDGYTGILISESPTKSMPNIVAQVTGTRPWMNGYLGNSGKTLGVGLGPVFNKLALRDESSVVNRFTTVFDEYNGSRTLIASSNSVKKILKLLNSTAHVDAPVLYTALDQVPDLIHSSSSRMTWVYVPELDLAGHAGPHSDARFREALDGLLAALDRVMNRSEATLLLTSDHGVIDGGGHGGDERNAKEGVIFLTPIQGETQEPKKHHAIDVAPTLAALLGTSAPRYNQGASLVGGVRLEHPSGILYEPSEPSIDAVLLVSALVFTAISTWVWIRWPISRKPAAFVLFYYALSISFFLFYFTVIDRVDEEFLWGFSQLGAYVESKTVQRLVVTIVTPLVITPWLFCLESTLAVAFWTLNTLVWIAFALLFNHSARVYNDADAQAAYRAEHVFLMSLPLLTVSVLGAAISNQKCHKTDGHKQ